MEPIFTGDTIKDIINNINRGIIFVFWSNEKLLCYHKKELENNYIVPTESVVYCDSRENNSFLNESALPLLMKANGISQCKCNISNIVKTKAKFARITYVKFK